MIVVSYILVAYKSRAQIGAALRAVNAQNGDYEREVVIVDNYSQESCAEEVLRECPEAHLQINDHNWGYTAALNQALRKATGDYLFLLNPDVELRSDCTSILLQEFDNSDIWAAAPQLTHADGTVQSSVRNFPTFATLIWDFTGLSKLMPKSKLFGRWRNRYFDHLTRCEVAQPMASAFMFKREVLQTLGEWDERFFVFFSDVDYCKRIRDGGGKIIFQPEAGAIHKLGGSTRQEGSWLIYESHRSFYRYLAKHELVGIKYLLRPVAAILLSLGALLRAGWRRLRGRSF